MAYSSTNPPCLTSQRLGGGMAIWTYKSTDAIATVAGTSYFSNADALGMKVYDVVLVVNTASTLTSVATVVSVTSGAGGTVLATLTAT